MKKTLLLLPALFLALSASTVHAQFGPPGGNLGGRGFPKFDASLSKLFGDNSAFSAVIEVHTKDGATRETMSLPGKLAFLDGKSRFEMDMTQIKGGSMPPDAAVQMKAMGMDDFSLTMMGDYFTAYANN